VYSSIRWITATLLLWAASSGQASAHFVNSGLGPFYDGVAHLFLTPEDLLVVVALALLAGLGGKPFGRTVLLVLPAAWLVGFLASRPIPLAPEPLAISAVILFALGALVAADRRLPLTVTASIALLCGFWNGSMNGAAMTGNGLSGLAGVGIACGVFGVVALVAGQVTALWAAWMRNAVRVAGSWIAAIGLLMFGWAVR
jgi:hydrogenase/urease accessory protein HupE